MRGRLVEVKVVTFQLSQLLPTLLFQIPFQIDTGRLYASRLRHFTPHPGVCLHFTVVGTILFSCNVTPGCNTNHRGYTSLCTPTCHTGSIQPHPQANFRMKLTIYTVVFERGTTCKIPMLLTSRASPVLSQLTPFLNDTTGTAEVHPQWRQLCK